MLDGGHWFPGEDSLTFCSLTQLVITELQLHTQPSPESKNYSEVR